MRLSLVATVVVLSALPLAAQSNDLAVWGSYSSVVETNAGGTTIKFDEGTGAGVSLNHFWTERLSTEVSAFALSHDGALRINGQRALDLRSLDLRPITLVGQWHIRRAARISPYLGIGASYVMADDLESSDLDAAGIGKVEVDSGTGLALNAGFDIRINPRFTAAIDVKHVRYRPDSKARGGVPVELKLNPVLVSAGLRWRW